MDVHTEMERQMDRLADVCINRQTVFGQAYRVCLVVCRDNKEKEVYELIVELITELLILDNKYIFYSVFGVKVCQRIL